MCCTGDLSSTSFARSGQPSLLCVCFFDCCCPACFTSSSLNRTDRARARPAPSMRSHVLSSVRNDINLQFGRPADVFRFVCCAPCMPAGASLNRHDPRTHTPPPHAHLARLVCPIERQKRQASASYHRVAPQAVAGDVKSGYGLISPAPHITCQVCFPPLRRILSRASSNSVKPMHKIEQTLVQLRQ